MSLFKTIYGATPIEDASDLIPTHITNRDELNEWEAANILEATQKYLTRRKRLSINIKWLKEIHKNMFNKTWKWAGKFRIKNYNIGVDWHNVQQEIKMLIDDLVFWEEKSKDINLFEQSVRIHHRLVKIHPFVNGNGRHARLVSDIFLFFHNHKLPIWPDKNLIEETNIRKEYIKALQSADKGNYKLLEKFTGKLIK